MCWSTESRMQSKKPLNQCGGYTHTNDSSMKNKNIYFALGRIHSCVLNLCAHWTHYRSRWKSEKEFEQKTNNIINGFTLISRCTARWTAFNWRPRVSAATSLSLDLHFKPMWCDVVECTCDRFDEQPPAPPKPSSLSIPADAPGNRTGCPCYRFNNWTPNIQNWLWGVR